MVALPVAAGWFAYAIGIWGFCLVRGYDVSFRDCMRMSWPGPGIAPPSGGHKLGTVTGHASTTNPGQLLGPGGP